MTDKTDNTKTEWTELCRVDECQSFHVRLSEITDYSMHYEIVESDGMITQTRESVFGDRGSTDPDDGDLVLHGFVKWDGCSDFDLGVGDSYRTHICGSYGMDWLPKVMRALYDLGSKTIKKWDTDDYPAHSP